ncbi:uncharacterized protein V6R79_018296 [Siganus canaliculatus]
MSHTEWTNIFKTATCDLPQEDTWHLEFDDTLIPHSPNFGWHQYIKNTSARFRCSSCGRGWPSNKVIVVFHMCLANEQGIVKVRRFRQNCKVCEAAPMGIPSISPENIDILLTALVLKIRRNCYGEDLGQNERHFVNLDVNSPHEPDHCEACRAGICARSASNVN